VSVCARECVCVCVCVCEGYVTNYTFQVQVVILAKRVRKITKRNCSLRYVRLSARNNSVSI